MNPDLLENRSTEIFNEQYDILAKNTDRWFAFLLSIEWLVGIGFALWLSPLTWSGDISKTHIHVYAAIFLGAAILLTPLFFVFERPGKQITRNTIAVAQILYSILFIHLMGGRIEAHFHIFGSLAFLAFYRDPRPVLVATAVTAIDHLVRGAFWPQSVYGTLSATPWRALEHAAWVIFEDICLLSSIRLSLQEMRSVAEGKAKLENALVSIEAQVKERTQSLEDSQRLVLFQQQNLIQSAKLASLGELSAGIAHEINNPLAIIEGSANLLPKAAADPEKLVQKIETILKSCSRISRIVGGLKKFSRSKSNTDKKTHLLSNIINECIVLTGVKSKRQSTLVKFELEKDALINCDEVEIEQVLINLINNAIDAVSSLPEKWVHIKLSEENGMAVLQIIDSGLGIPETVAEKIFDPFFTTKPVGEGTGLGLSISKAILRDHEATININIALAHTCFEIRIPKLREEVQHAA